jgi:small VCP/p97-interacting protein
MAEAAERRQQEQQSRGVKNPESVKRMQQKSLETERLEQEQAMASGGQSNLRWTQG